MDISKFNCSCLYRVDCSYFVVDSVVNSDLYNHDRCVVDSEVVVNVDNFLYVLVLDFIVSGNDFFHLFSVVGSYNCAYGFDHLCLNLIFHYVFVFCKMKVVCVNNSEFDLSHYFF